MGERGEVMARVEDLARELLDRHWLCVTAESCTGGGIAEALTRVAGSSNWFERGFVTYSNESKRELLGVAAETIERFGAVSEETAREMAEGALKHSRGQVAMAVTGIAGPEGGTADKPVGMVVFAWAIAGAPTTVQIRRFEGDRAVIRDAAVEQAIEGLLVLLRR